MNCWPTESRVLLLKSRHRPCGTRWMAGSRRPACFPDRPGLRSPEAPARARRPAKAQLLDSGVTTCMPHASHILFLGLLPACPTSVYPFSLGPISCSSPAVSCRFNWFFRSPVRVNLLADKLGPRQINFCTPPLPSCNGRNCVHNIIS